MLYFLDDRLKACLQEFEIGESEFVFGHEDGPTQSAWHQRRSKEISRWESVRPDIFRALVCAAEQIPVVESEFAVIVTVKLPALCILCTV